MASISPKMFTGQNVPTQFRDKNFEQAQALMPVPAAPNDLLQSIQNPMHIRRFDPKFAAQSDVWRSISIDEVPDSHPEKAFFAGLLHQREKVLDLQAQRAATAKEQEFRKAELLLLQQEEAKLLKQKQFVDEQRLRNQAIEAMTPKAVKMPEPVKETMPELYLDETPQAMEAPVAAALSATDIVKAAIDEQLADGTLELKGVSNYYHKGKLIAKNRADAYRWIEANCVSTVVQE